MKISSRLIVGSAIGITMIAVAIDHTKHRLPAAMDDEVNIIIEGEEDVSPCSMGDNDSNESPCSMGE